MSAQHPAGPEVLGASECWALLRSIAVGRIGVRDADDIDIFPINFAVDGGTIVFRTAPGTKMTRLRASAAVTFEADEVDAVHGLAWSVVIKGSAHQIRSMDELADSTELRLFPYEQSPKGLFMRIEPSAISGRRFDLTEQAHWLVPEIGRRSAPE